MPKVNVYLPDALADRVREARLPISRICQAALTRALDGTDGMTRSADAETPLPEPIGLTPQPNHHVAAILRQSHDIAAGRGAATVEPVDILQAFLDEGRASSGMPSNCWASPPPRSRPRSTTCSVTAPDPPGNPGRPPRCWPTAPAGC
ncbi:hypothetical protein [Polymorphospora rubra]|uniref:Uncharacterized protein n=1 Tax=Polymorphospora rubra TaxID=338584 RepID=A0A810N956_9ACTN|nr:hypothetical protein [Polymorphospora rubra]BCJ68123.1 hypothetical protein Prubr_51440 [Polymorphospora rubra]